MAEGHLDCMFDCGLKFSDLETLYLHVELDHREDNSVSPFAVGEPKEATLQLPARLLSSTSKETRSREAKFDGQAGRDEHQQYHSGRHDEAEDNFVQCPEEGCEELILVADLNDHLDFHDAQQATLEEAFGSTSLAPSLPARVEGRSSSSSSSHLSASDSVTSLSRGSKHKGTHTPDVRPEDDGDRPHIGRRLLTKFKIEMTGKEAVNTKNSSDNMQRLGKSELGPFAYEAQMPSSMLKKLREGPRITKTRRLTRNGGLITHEQVEGQTNGVMPILRQLIDMDHMVYKAYLCHPSVTQIGKRSWETGFCGYHNTQMAISYIQNAKHAAHTLFPGYIPGVLDIQDWIETAWDEGINTHARAEFGGLRGTRKWIGTLEIDTLYQYMGIPHQIHQFHDTLEVNNQYAEQNLLDWVELYFKSAAVEDGSKVRCTLKPPIYFQRPGHSMTIVGIERMKDGKRNLLVFDPMYTVPTAMLQLIEKGRVRSANEKLLRLYRRSQHRLYHYADFEATTLEGDLPLLPAWDILLRPHPGTDYFVTVVDWLWELHPLDEFHPCFPWHLYGSVFRMEEARFLPDAVSTILGLCVPRVYSRDTGLDYEDWLFVEHGAEPLAWLDSQQQVQAAVNVTEVAGAEEKSAVIDVCPELD